MLNFLIWAVASKYAQIITGQERIIDTFEQNGLILYSELQYQTDGPQPCYIQKQTLNQSKLQSLQIIEQFDERDFRNSFQNGHFTKQFSYILAQVHVPRGAVILTSEQELIFLKFKDGQFEINAKTKLSVGIPDKPLFMEYVQLKQSIIIILNGITVLQKFQDDQFGSQIRLYEAFRTDRIQSILSVDKAIMLALGDDGLAIFEVEDNRLHQIAVNISANIQDLKAYHDHDIYFIFALDLNKGVIPFIYNSASTIFSIDKRWSDIYYPGHIMDIFGDKLIVVQKQKQFSIAFDLMLNFKDHTYTLQNQYRLQHDIIDIDITNDYALVLGTNGLEFIYHSVPAQPQRRTNVVIPSLKKLDFLTEEQNNETNYIFGISQHTFFFSKLRIEPEQIVCFSEQLIEDVNFQFIFNSTKCPNQVLSTCSITQNYQVHFVKPWINSDSKLLIYSLASLVILSFLALVVLLIKEYCVFSTKIQQNVTDLTVMENSMKSNEITLQINTFDSPNKFAKFGSQQLQLSQLKE